MWQSNNILEAPIMAAKNIKSSTNAEGPGPREHTVCWILAKDWTTVQKIPFKKASNRWTTFNVTGIGANRLATLPKLFSISLPL